MVHTQIKPGGTLKTAFTYPESSVGHNGTSKLGVEVFLVGHTCPKLLLPEHLPERNVVVVRVDANHLAGFRVSLLDGLTGC